MSSLLYQSFCLCKIGNNQRGRDCSTNANKKSSANLSPKIQRKNGLTSNHVLEASNTHKKGVSLPRYLLITNAFVIQLTSNLQIFINHLYYDILAR